MYPKNKSIKSVSIIIHRENKKEKDNENIYEIVSVSKRESENVDYISVRGRLCAATPSSVIANRTPPPPSQKHHFTQKHQINFCIDEIHRATSQR